MYYNWSFSFSYCFFISFVLFSTSNAKSSSRSFSSSSSQYSAASSLSSISLGVKPQRGTHTALDQPKHHSSSHYSDSLAPLSNSTPSRSNSTTTSSKNDIITKEYSQVVAQSLVDEGCHIYSFKCRLCGQFKGCRYCALKNLENSELVVERGDNGIQQVVGICIDLTRENWDIPIMIKKNPPQYARCGIIVPDFNSGATCFDIEQAGHYPRYRKGVQRLAPKIFNYAKIRLNVLAQDVGKPSLKEIINEGHHRDVDVSPVDAILYFVVIPASILFTVSILTILASSLCRWARCCCFPCICGLRVVRYFRRRNMGDLEGNEKNNTECRSAGEFQMNPLNEIKSPGLEMRSPCLRSPRFDSNFISDVATTTASSRGSWSNSTLGHSNDPLIMSIRLNEPFSQSQREPYPMYQHHQLLNTNYVNQSTVQNGLSASLNDPSWLLQKTQNNDNHSKEHRATEVKHDTENILYGYYENDCGQTTGHQIGVPNEINDDEDATRQSFDYYHHDHHNQTQYPTSTSPISQCVITEQQVLMNALKTASLNVKNEETLLRHGYHRK